MTQAQSLLSRIGSRLKLSLLAALAGFSAGIVVVLLLSVRAFLFAPTSQPNPFIFAMIFCIAMGVFVAVIWIILLVPLSLLVPIKAAFWQPANLALIGAIVGALIMLLYALWERHGTDIHHSSPLAQWNDYLAGTLIFGVPAAIVGGVTGYVAAILNRRS